MSKQFLTRARPHAASTAPSGKSERSQHTDGGAQTFPCLPPAHRVSRRGLTVEQGGEGAGEERGPGERRGVVREAGQGVGGGPDPRHGRQRGARPESVILLCTELHSSLRRDEGKERVQTESTRSAARRGRGFLEPLQRQVVRRWLGACWRFQERILGT